MGAPEQLDGLIATAEAHEAEVVATLERVRRTLTALRYVRSHGDPERIARLVAVVKQQAPGVLAS
jgi:hypothetical protein